MTDKELIKLVTDNYLALAESLSEHPDNYGVFHQVTTDIERQESKNLLGDTLVLFVVREIKDMIQGEDPEQWPAVIEEALNRAASELETLAEAFYNYRESL